MADMFRWPSSPEPDSPVPSDEDNHPAKLPWWEAAPSTTKRRGKRAREERKKEKEARQERRRVRREREQKEAVARLAWKRRFAEEMKRADEAERLAEKEAPKATTDEGPKLG